MNEIAYFRLVEMAAEPEALEKTVGYVEKNMRRFLRKRERVLICVTEDYKILRYIFEQAVLRCDAIPVFPADMRWKTLLREAFSKRCAALVGHPLMVLGLAKLAKRMETPLFTRNVILVGYPTTKWMMEGIRYGLDCKLWGCYDPGSESIVAGFSCNATGGIHLRSDIYGVDVVDDQGGSSQEGEVVLYHLSAPQIRFHTGDTARIDRSPCKCGCAGPKLLDFDPVRGVDQDLSRLGEQLQLWTSILDCRLAKTGYGLELEIITFPGEKLPKLPSCAKLVVRNWDPETDEPFPHMYVLKKRHFP